MVYDLFRALPGDHRFVDPVIRATRWRLANLTPASGRQNHTASPSATASARLTLRRVHRIPPRERGDRVSPLCWDGTGKSILLIFRFVKDKFCKSEFCPACGRAAKANIPDLGPTGRKSPVSRSSVASAKLNGPRLARSRPSFALPRNFAMCKSRQSTRGLETDRPPRWPICSKLAGVIALAFVSKADALLSG